MTSTRFLSRILCLGCLIPVLGVAASSRQASSALAGTWSGTFQSKHPSRSPFTMTVVIAPGADGKLIGNASVIADCFTDPVLQVSVNGPKVVLAGSDTRHTSVTFIGSLDTTGTLLTMDYIVGGGGGGRCESDRGEGSMARR